MDRPLAGRSILIVEDEPLIAIDIQIVFEAAGAKTTLARTLRAALVAAEAADLSAAILDHALGDGNSAQLCERLKERDIPFLIYSGFKEFDGAHVEKPATPSVLIASVVGLLARRPISN
jgi:DNA-binding response OmpR family regulator